MKLIKDIIINGYSVVSIGSKRLSACCIDRYPFIFLPTSLPTYHNTYVALCRRTRLLQRLMHI